jgi:hypothetical protein
MIRLVRRPRPNPYEVADSMQRLDRHLDAFTASARHYMRVSPRPPQLVHDAYRNLVAVAVVLQPLKQALKQYDELDAPLSSKELGLRAIQLVVLELAPTAIALAREDTRLSESRVEFERKLYSLQQETRRIANRDRHRSSRLAATAHVRGSYKHCLGCLEAATG